MELNIVVFLLCQTIRLEHQPLIMPVHILAWLSTVQCWCMESVHVFANACVHVFMLSPVFDVQKGG